MLSLWLSWALPRAIWYLRNECRLGNFYVGDLWRLIRRLQVDKCWGKLIWLRMLYLSVGLVVWFFYKFNNFNNFFNFFNYLNWHFLHNLPDYFNGLLYLFDNFDGNLLDNFFHNVDGFFNFFDHFNLHLPNNFLDNLNWLFYFFHNFHRNLLDDFFNYLHGLLNLPNHILENRFFNKPNNLNWHSAFFMQPRIMQVFLRFVWAYMVIILLMNGWLLSVMMTFILPVLFVLYTLVDTRTCF